MVFKKRYLTKNIIFLSTYFLFISFCPFVFASENKEDRQNQLIEKINWQDGPLNANLGTYASIYVPKDYVFVNENDMAALKELNESLYSGNELGAIIAPEGKWIIFFNFHDVGYISESEKDDLNAERLLNSLIQGNAYANEEKQKRGWETLEIVGWKEKPHYDKKTHNLEWALLGKNNYSNRSFINHNVRLLGRKGYVSVVFVTNPEIYNRTVPAFKQILAKFAYTPDENYTAFKQGDKMAKIGLSALVLGGATAVAVKSGFFKHIWKLGVFLVLGLFGAIKKLFSKSSS